MHIEAKYLRTLEFAYCATVGLWLVPQSKMGFYEGPLPPIVDAFSGLVILAMLLLILKNALFRDAKRWGLILMAATIAAFGIFSKSFEHLVYTGMDYKLPYVLFSYIQPFIAIFGWFIAWASWSEKRRIRNPN
ncbi:hypothetical protein [Croceicoccus bisphenolivorans]|uniref:hypothetical protein n=1 Tax=Croceicoccus bisphenolivorans TaxID=1783232 RepID=UPI00082B43D5|nr:hypothetical protein [Croceicoccus bisphenolivorans]